MKLKSLFQFCIDFIASNAHEIESLENFPLGTIHILRNHFQGRRAVHKKPIFHFLLLQEEITTRYISICIYTNCDMPIYLSNYISFFLPIASYLSFHYLVILYISCHHALLAVISFLYGSTLMRMIIRLANTIEAYTLYIPDWTIVNRSSRVRRIKRP